MRPVAALATVLTVAVASAGLGVWGATATAATRALAWDFDGDGYRDLAVGVHRGFVDGQETAGYVVVLPGSADGPNPARKYIVSQAAPGVPGEPEVADNFGIQLLSHDLNSDGYAELVTIASGDLDQPMVIHWGSKSGLSAATAIIGNGLEYMGNHGIALADVTGDGRGDIVAVGGSGGGSSDHLWVVKGPFTPGTNPTAAIKATVPQDAEADGLAAGDFNRDGRADVAVPYTTEDGPGATFLLRGTGTGLVPQTSWYRETAGESIVSADFNRDGYADLAYGVARTDAAVPKYPAPADVGGVVRIVYGSSSGPAGARKPMDISQETAGVPGTGKGGLEVIDGFGWALAVADIDGDGDKDLAVGTPREDIGSLSDTGSVTVLWGTSTGISGAGAKFFTQNSAYVPGANEAYDEWGYSVKLHDVNGNVRPELIVGVPGEDGDSGRVVTLHGSASGVSGIGSRSYSATGLGLPPGNQFGNRFGDVVG